MSSAYSPEPDSFWLKFPLTAGFSVNAQQNPLAVTAEDPSFLTLPVNLTCSASIMAGGRVSTSEGVSLLQQTNNTKLIKIKTLMFFMMQSLIGFDYQVTKKRNHRAV
jgi:hypothetical protein